MLNEKKRDTMTAFRTSILAAVCGAALLAGCSSGTASVNASASADASTGNGGAGSGTGGAAFTPSGVTGEIAYLSEGVAQVQDSSSQTAVRFTAATVFTKEVTLTLADVTVGRCVVATLSDAGTASAISVTDADASGQCATGMGAGGGAAPGGQAGANGSMPSAAPGGGTPPTAMPGGGTPPTAMPGGGTMPSGGPTSASLVTGTVATVSADSITVTGTDGAATVVTATAADITGTAPADSSAIVVGMCMTATGESDDVGGYDATAISVFTKGDSGCVAAGAFGAGNRNTAGTSAQGAGTNG
jgi:hypothetical protein